MNYLRRTYGGGVVGVSAVVGGKRMVAACGQFNEWRSVIFGLTIGQTSSRGRHRHRTAHHRRPVQDRNRTGRRRSAWRVGKSLNENLERYSDVRSRHRK